MATVYIEAIVNWTTVERKIMHATSEEVGHNPLI